jgi:hypothetical protein
MIAAVCGRARVLVPNDCFSPTRRPQSPVEFRKFHVIFGAHLKRTPAEVPVFQHVHFGAVDTLISERRSIAPVFYSGKTQFLVAGRLECGNDASGS